MIYKKGSALCMVKHCFTVTIREWEYNTTADKLYQTNVTNALMKRRANQNPHYDLEKRLEFYIVKQYFNDYKNGRILLLYAGCIKLALHKYC